MTDAGERLVFAALARKSAHSRCLGHSPFRCQFVFSGVTFQLFERQRQLLDRARSTLRPLAVDLTLEFEDPQASAGRSASRLPRLSRMRPSAAISKALARSTASARFRAATSPGMTSQSHPCDAVNYRLGCVGTPQNACNPEFFAQPALCDRQLSCGIPPVDSFQI